ncbi:MAG: winged helix-turn-helix transcriptional regulator [Pararhodobacter sp.]|nr:winged helix-turn-helix transcriptional regulator [Pararhodobacter sp.]
MNKNQPNVKRQNPINVPDFSSGEHLPQVLNLTLRAVNERLGQELRAINLPLTHWRIIAILKSRGKCTLSEVAELTVVEISTLSRSVKRLEEEGLVERTWEKGDNRRRALGLTDKGDHIFHDAWALVSNFYNYIFADVSDGDRETIRAAMNRVVSRLERKPWDEPIINELEES